MSELAEQTRTARQIWARPDGRHDFTVRWLRRLLPMGVGALGAILVVSPIANARVESSFMLAKDSVDLAKERMRVTAATYRGRDSEGRPFVLSAASAVQATSQEAIVKVTDVNAEMTMAEGVARIQAKDAVYNMDDEVVSVIGPVFYQSADGYQLAMTNVAINMRTRQVQSNGSVSGESGKGNVAGGSLSADMKSRQVALGGGVSASTSAGSISGGAAQADLNNRTVSVSGGVSGKTSAGTFNGSAMQADLASRKVAISGGVSGQTRLGSFVGQNLNADLAAKRVTITGGVSGRTRFGTYSANTLTVDENRRTLVLEGRARLTLNPRGL